MSILLSEVERMIDRYADLKSGNALASGQSPADLSREKADLLAELKLVAKHICELIPQLHSKEMQSTYCHVINDLIAVL